MGYIERDGRSFVASEKGLNVVRLLDRHALTSPGSPATGSAGSPASSTARRRARRSWATSRVRRLDGRRARRQAQGRPDPASQPRSLPRLRAGHRREPQGLLVLVARGPRHCGFVIWKSKAGKTLTPAIVREARQDGAHRGSRSPASRGAPGARSARSSRSCRRRRAAGAWSSTSRGPAGRQAARDDDSDDPAAGGHPAAAGGLSRDRGSGRRAVGEAPTERDRPAAWCGSPCRVPAA